VSAELRQNRPLIVAASLGSGALGLLPVPLVNDLSIGVLRALLVQRLASSRSLELSSHAALVVAGELSPSLARLATAAALSVGLRLAWRRLGRSLLLLLRFDDVGQTFLLGTFFDYYCLQHHPGGPIDPQRAAAIHRAIDAAATRARIQLVSAVISRAWSELTRAGSALPGGLWALCTALLVGQRHEPPPLAEVAEVAAGAEAAAAESFLARVTTAVERELSSADDRVLDTLCQAFDQAWASAGGCEAAMAPRHHFPSGSSKESCR